MTLYNLRSPDIITKWDADGNIEAQYSTSEDACTCPAGHRHTCRHRQMLPLLMPIADTHWFLDWDNGKTVVDFSGVPKSHYEDFEPLHLGEPLIIIEGEMKNQFVVIDSKPTTAIAPATQPSWRRI